LSLQLSPEAVLVNIQRQLDDQLDLRLNLITVIDNIKRAVSEGTSTQGQAIQGLNQRLVEAESKIIPLKSQLRLLQDEIDFRVTREIIPIQTQNVTLTPIVENIPMKIEEVVESIKLSVGPIFSGPEGNNNLLIGAAAIGVILLIL